MAREPASTHQGVRQRGRRGVWVANRPRAHVEIRQGKGARRHNAYNLGDCGLCVCEEQLCAVTDNAAEFLSGAGKEARDIHKGDEGDVEGIAEADKARALDTRVDVEAAGRGVGLVAHNTHSAAVHAREPNHNVLGELRHDLKEVAVVNNL